MNKAATLDAIERMFWTALEVFGGALLASPIFDSLGIGWEGALKIAIFATGASLVKSIVAIAITHNSTPQLGVDTYDNKPAADTSP